MLPPHGVWLIEANCIFVLAVCKSGMIYMEHAPTCVRTCGDPHPKCNSGTAPKCVCPRHRPILHENHCIKESACPIANCKYRCDSNERNVFKGT